MARKKKSIAGRLLFLINLIFGLGLLFAWLSSFVPPHIFSVAGLLTLIFPIFWGINLLFFALWLFRLNKRMFFSLILLAVTYPSIQAYYSQGKKETEEAKKPANLRVMSYNVRMFNVYEWIKEKDIPQKQKALISEVNADVLAIQEYYRYEKTPTLDYPHQYVHYTGPNQRFGLALMSKYPLENRRAVTFEQAEGMNNEFIMADIELPSGKIRIINAHLASFYFDTKDFERLKKSDLGTEDIKMSLFSIVKRLFSGFSRRSLQLQSLLNEIDMSPYPVVLCIDANDTPASYTYRQLTSRLADSFVGSGTSFGRTYAETFLPLRIDMILYPKNWKCSKHKICKKEGVYSDHLPILAEFQVE